MLIEFYSIKTLQKDLLKLAETVMDKTVVPSNQFCQEVSCELQRLALYASVSLLRMSALPQLQSRVSAIDRHMDPTKPFTAEMEWHVERRLNKCKDVVPELKITGSKRIDLSLLMVKVMSEQAWSVCSNGHIQYNGVECVGVENILTRRPTCTECVALNLQHLHF